jgi:uncharacterized protein YebE (UPF0316 family)
MKLLLIFILLNVANVIIQTAKSLLTVNGGKVVASIANAVAYGLYTIVLIYMTCDLSTWVKALIVAVCNLIGVYIVKLFEEKSRKDKLWKVEMTVKQDKKESMVNQLREFNISFNYVDGIGEYIIFNAFCQTQQDSKFVKEIANRNNAKYFVSESKVL